MYLIDTMVISEYSKSRPNQNVLAWFKAVRFSDAYLSVVTVGEIERGFRKFEKREGRPNERHLGWLETTLQIYGRRVLPLTTDIMRRWGRLSWDIGNTDPDLLIAATALEHDLIVVTRNISDFAPAGVKLLNPYET